MVRLMGRDWKGGRGVLEREGEAPVLSGRELSLSVLTLSKSICHRDQNCGTRNKEKGSLPGGKRRDTLREKMEGQDSHKARRAGRQWWIWEERCREERGAVSSACFEWISLNKARHRITHFDHMMSSDQ